MDDTLARAQQPHVHSFSTDASHDSLRVRCTLKDSAPAYGDCLYHSGLTWRLHTANNDFVLCMVRGSQQDVYQTLYLSENFTNATLYSAQADAHNVMPYLSLDGAVFQLWANFLFLRHRRIVLHALGVKRPEGTHLFLGKSGAGKTTLSHLVNNSQVGTILSDDRIVVQPVDNSFRAFGTPWNGDLKFYSADDAPIQAIYFLAQTPSCELVSLCPAEAAAQLFACSFIAGWPMRDAVNYVLETTATLARSVPCYRLGFTPNRQVLETLRWV